MTKTPKYWNKAKKYLSQKDKTMSALIKKYEAEVEAFKFKKEFEFVSVNPSSVQGPGRVSGTAELLISSLNKKY